MNKLKCNNKIGEFFYVFKCAMLILSAIIGAGLASGQEVVVYFAQYGFISIFFLIILFFLFYYGLTLFFNFGNRICYSNDFVIEEKKFVRIFERFSLIIFGIIGSAMVACTDELLNQVVYRFNFPVWGLLAITLSSVVVYFGLKTLLNMSAYLVPFIVVSIIYVCLHADVVYPTSKPAFSSDFFNVFMLSLSSVSYCCCNLVVSNKLLFNIGGKINKRQIKWVSLIISTVLVLLIGIIIVSILINDNMVLFSDLPLVYMAFLIDSSIGYFFSVIMLISILTTLFAAQYSFHDIANKSIKKKPLIFLLSFILFFGLSMSGFGEIINYFYPIIGAIGFVAFIYLRKSMSKSRFNTADDKVHSTRQNT